MKYHRADSIEMDPQGFHISIYDEDMNYVAHLTEFCGIKSEYAEELLIERAEILLSHLNRG